MRRWIKRLALAVFGLVVLAALVGAGYAWRVTPVHDGALKLQGLAGEVRVERDGHGIPTVRASSVRDAMYGLGFVHAQDRLWQLETHRRIGAGRLAEAFGAGALDTDRFLRALGVRRAAQAQWERTGGEAREALLAYTDGVNAVIGAASWALPPEFLVLGIKPEPWSPVDSLAWAIMMAWDLGGNWNAELARLRLASRLPLDRINELIPPYPGEAAVPTRDYPALYAELGLRAGAQRKALVDLPGIAPPSGIEGVGSNNWVIAGTRSATGSPLLANDPHLRLSAPALWYFARLEAPGLKSAGATMPGLPSIVLGQNADIAWGFTNTGPDVQDLYLERVKADEAARYLTPDGDAAFEVREETVRVKGQVDVKLRLRSTRHGPVISDAGTLPDVVGARPEDAPLVLALRWTALDADADPIGAGLKMMRARSVDEFVDGSASWVAPMQSMVVADRAGRIGFVAAGRVPLRRADNDLQGLAPAPGWDARYDWAGWLAPGQTPREFDPPRGWLATANQRIHDADYPHFITHEWTLPFRQQRIEQLLQARPRHTLDDLARMQADETSLAVAPVLPWLRAALPEHRLTAPAQAALAAWDGRMSADSAAPLIYWAWLRQLTRALFADEAGAEDFERLFGPRTFFDAVLGVVARDDAWWCDDKTTPAVESCAQVSARAMAAALEELSQRFGPEVSAWRWGLAHASVAEHRPFSRVAALARVFELRTPVGGDSYTVNASRVTLKPHPTTGELYLNEHGPSLRALYDVASPARSRVMHSSGQSGLPWATRYRSFLQRWAGVDYVPLWAEGAEATAGGSLVLQPAGR